MQSATVLIVEADRELQQRLFAQTRGHGYTALAAATVDDAIGALESAVIHVALVDLLLGKNPASRSSVGSRRDTPRPKWSSCRIRTP